MDIKPVDGANDGLLKKAEEPAKPVEGELKRQEPPVPHAPQDNPAQNAPDQRKSEDEHMNEKRQLMSHGEEDKSTNPENVVARKNNLDGVAARNVADANQVKVSEQEIDAELKKLEQSDKVTK